jgi:DNA-binding transcriptional ArsR family regulator
MVIQALVRRGVYVCDIARQLGVHPKTVSRALARWSSPAPARKPRKSVLDPYRAQIDQLLAEGVWNAQVIFCEVQARGYAGQVESFWLGSQKVRFVLMAIAPLVPH